jgi:hypothetical protein
MKPQKPTDLAASVRQRLLDLSRRTKTDPLHKLKD